MSSRFDAGKPPRVSINPAEPVVEADFTLNEGAAVPFYAWLASGDAWAAFVDWHDQSGFAAHGEAPVRHVAAEDGSTARGLPGTARADLYGNPYPPVAGEHIKRLLQQPLGDAMPGERM
jgi:hypothetical protein